MKRCLIVGSGIAGLTAASILSSKKIPVTLIESSPKFGGRTFSFKESQSGDIIDNGQHILMGCYDETLSFIKLIGAENNLLYQKNLRINFLSKRKEGYSIKASSLFYPLNLLSAVCNYDALNLIEKFKFIRFLLKLPFISKKSLVNLSVREWLENGNQDEILVKSFWGILCVGALNASPDNASALIFYDILLRIFFKGNFASTIILPKYGLSESIINPAISFIKKYDGKIISSERVKKFTIDNEKIVQVKSDSNTYNDVDYVISAIPLYALEKIIPKEELGIKTDLSYSTILNIHIWLKENPLKEKFYGLIDSQLHWIFNKGSHINIVVSNANDISNKTDQGIIELAINELEKFTYIKRELMINYRIIKERRATFIADKNSLFDRPKSGTKIKNLFLAGDWTDTSLPSTIEGAAKSGRIAAENVMNEIINY